MKKNTVTMIVILLICVIPISAILCAGFLLPPQFDETYYGELAAMYNRLYSIKEKKIIIIGNSNVAFGLRSDLIENALRDYQVVNFGLYGAIGTQAMLDLSRGALREGDVVIIAPEQFSQSLSLYFSGRDTWKALDGNFKMAFSFSDANAKVLAGSFPEFVFDKFQSFVSGSKPALDDVYQKAAFERDGFDTGYMTYDRPYNIMPGGYDPNNLICFDTAIIGDGFLDYLNEYYEYAYAKGASVYFDFAPMNRLGIAPDVDDQQIDAYYTYLSDNLHFRIIGNPFNYILDHEWFYDNNYHMNSAGMLVHTRQMLEDIKSALGISTPTYLSLPEKPLPPAPGVVSGDNSDTGYFVYEDTAEGLIITGLTDEGKAKTTMTIPASKDGKPILYFTADTFAGNQSITSITLPENIRILYNSSFDGCTQLTTLILKHTAPSSIGVGSNLLAGAPSCRIYVPNSVLSTFSTHYNWSAFADELRGY